MKNSSLFKNSKLKFILPVLIVAGMLLGFRMANEPDPEKDKILIGLVRYALKQGHYEPHQVNDEFSEKVFTDFIDQLDPYKRFFLQSDIEEMEVYKHMIDDQIKSEDLTFYNVAVDRFLQRVEESKSIYKEILSSPFDFSKEGSFDVDYDKKPFAQNQAELIKYWQMQLKWSTLSRLHEKIELQEQMANVPENEEEGTAEDSGETADAEPVEIKSFEELEKDSREMTESSLDDIYEMMGDLDDSDWFSIFLNTMTMQFDPHTNYYAPKEKKRFDQIMAGKLEGTRLVLMGAHEKAEPKVELATVADRWIFSRLAAVTQALPGPTILSTRGMPSMP